MPRIQCSQCGEWFEFDGALRLGEDPTMLKLASCTRHSPLKELADG